MPNFNNSLVNLITISFIFFLFTFLKADNNEFILPKKKIIQLNSEIKETKKEYKVSERNNVLKNQNIEDKNLPRKKPNINQTTTINDPEKKKSEISEIKKIEIISKEINDKIKPEISVVQNIFLYPTKKPLTFKTFDVPTIEKSEILNDKDYILAKEVFDLIEKNKWNDAIILSKKFDDKEVINLVNWLLLKEQENQATFNDYYEFILKNPDYPRINRLRYLAEHKILLKNSSPRAIINWFEKELPSSGVGKIKLGEAYLEMGQNELAANLIKTGWIDADLSPDDLKYYKNKFNNILKTEDHLKRADYLAWNDQYWDLKRMLSYLPQNERLLYNARFILKTNSSGVDQAVADVPEQFKKDLGLQFDRLKWRVRRNRLEGSLEILKNFHGEETLKYAEKWWNLRENIARDLIFEKKYSEAYEVSSNHHLSEGPDYADAEWISGWLALSFLNETDLAIKHFINFYSKVGYPVSLSRGAYWLGLAYEKKADQEKALNFFKEASKFSNTFYGQLSYIKIKSAQPFQIPTDFTVKDGYENEFNKNKLIKHVKLLKELDKSKFSKDIIKHLASLNIDNGSEVLAAKLATEVGRFDYAIQVAKEASYEKRFINFYNYPVINTQGEINNKKMPAPELILAIIRQESEFDSRANSYVGAQGLMQLMPATAKLVSKDIGVTYNKDSLQKDPNYNVKLGTYYINSLLDDYDGVYPFAIAAYNAGPNKIQSWIKKYGDPNKKEISFVDWIELIRFEETRNYVQRVIENINVYKYILNNNKPIEINNYFRD
ncbi:MAG: lytic transglycosylase domain-containing protein [Proteobacteria bacterium]|nr:lytic transglycosylase domain-containing protein [Pseudomonadota bacterium]